MRTEQTVALTAPLTRRSAVNIPPVFITADEDEEPFPTTLRLFNDADVPLGLSGSFTRHPALQVTPSAFDVELEPNAVELIDLQVTSSGASLGGA